MANELPPGFELEQPPTPSSGLPPGFELEQPQSNEEQSNQEYAKLQANETKYGSLPQQAIAGAEAVGKGLAGPLATGAERLMGVPAEDIQGREEANPITSIAGNIAGLVSPVGQGALLAKAGSTALKGVAKVAPSIIGEGILKGASRGAVKLAAENALYSAGDETSKMILGNPDASIGNAIVNGGLTGALFGGGLGAISPLWKATVGKQAGQLAADFKGRINEHLTNPDMPGTLANEMGDYYKNIKEAASEVYGPQGIKATAISKSLPETVTPKIESQVAELSNKAETALQDMAKKQVPERYINKFKSDIDNFQSVITKPEVTPSEVFNAAQDFKQTIQGYSKGNYGPFAVPSYHEAYDFLNITKSLGHDVRTALENPEVWGGAAKAQQSINKALNGYLGPLKDFERRFTTEVNGERVVDPGKVNTYMNQLGKKSSEVKQSMLKNFMDASEQYKKVISDAHDSIGSISPVQPTSMNAMTNTLKEQTTGSKLADLFVKKSGDTGGKLLGGTIGGLAGALAHIPGASLLGTLIGEHALGPFLGSILPAIAKPILEKSASGEGFKAATEYSLNVAKGNKLSSSAVKNLFESGSKVIPNHKQPDSDSRKKLETALLKLQQDPTRLANASGQIGHYLPDHAAALGSTTQNIVTFLNSLRPQTAPQAPLDPPRQISKAVQSQYDRALDIAEQPLTVLESIKDNTITSHDVMALQHMYPGLYKGLQQKIMNQIVEHVSGENTVPYSLRLGLSIFMGQHLDSTMTPQAILAAQPMLQQPPQQVQGAKKVTQGAASQMTKGAKSMQTQAQASEAMHSSGAKA